MSAFDLSEEYEELRASVRRLAEDRIAPNAAAADEDEQYPWASWKAWQAAGFAGLAFPAAYGGQDGGVLAHAIAVEEVARVCASSSLFTFISKLAMTPVLAHGSQHLKDTYVARVAAGEAQASYCLSESEAGSDVASMQTRAVRDGEHYVLTGSKQWITNAGVSDYYTVFAKTDADAAHRGISVFVVESSFPGFSIGKLEHKMGVRGSPTGEVVLDGCIVPAANLIGEEGRGFHYAMGALDGSRPLVGAQALGIAQGALDLAVAYVGERRQFGRSLAEFQGLQFMLADMATEVDAGALARLPRLCPARCRPPRHRRALVDGQVVRVRHRDARRRPTACNSSVVSGTRRTCRPSASCATPRSPRSTRARTRSNGS